MDEHIAPTIGRSRGRLVLLVAFAISLMVAGLSAISWSLNTQSVQNALLRQVEQQTGHRVAFEEADLRLFPRPRLDLRHVKVFGGQPEAPLMSAKRLDVALQIVPLFEGRAVAAQVVFESPRLTVQRDPSGRWTIGEEKPETASDKNEGLLGFLALIQNLLIVDGEVTIFDDSGSAQIDPVHLTSLQLTLTEEIPGRSAKIEVSGEMPQGSAESAFLKMDGSLVMLHGANVESPDAADSVQAEGTIRIHRLDIRHLAGWFGLSPVPTDSVPPAQLVGRIRLAPRPVGYDLIVTDWKAGFSALSLEGSATFAGLGTEQPRVAATFFSSSVPLKQTLNQVPAEWLPADVRDKLSEDAVDGFVSLHGAHVEGALGKNESLSISGAIEIREGRYLPGGTHPAVREVSATVLYDLKQIRAIGLRGNYGPVRFSDGTVLVTEWRQDPMVDVRISGEVRAPDLVSLLTNQRRFPELATDLSQLEQMTGEVVMVAHVAGRPMKGDLELEEMAVTFSNVGFRHQAVAVPFRQIQASVTILPTEIRLDSLSGHAGFARMQGGGRVILAGEPSFHDMTLNMTVDDEAFAPWLYQASGERFRPVVEGPILLSVSITGAVRTPRFQGRLPLDRIDFHVPHVFAKAKGAPAEIRFEGELRKDLLLSVRRCELILPPVKLTGEGRIRLADDWAFRAKIGSDALSLDKLPQGVRLGPVSAGIIKAGLTIEGRATDRASWVTSGQLRFDNGVVEEQFQGPIRNLFMQLRFEGKHIDIQQLRFAVGNSDLRLSGSIVDWLEAPRAKLVVESSQIDLASLKLASSHGSSSSDSFPVIRTWWTNGSVDATALIDYLYYGQSLVSGLSCRIRFEHGSLKIDRISGDTDDGHLAGRLILNIPERGPRSVRSTLDVSGVPVDRLSTLMKGSPRLSGWLAARGGLQAEFNQEGLLRSSINSRRPITITVQNGLLYSAPVISKVLALLNLPTLLKGEINLTENGMPFDRLKVVFSVEGGIIKVSEYLLDSPVLKISGTGEYDFMDDDFDAVVVASPLGPYSDLLKSVPLFGKLFAGERQGFDAAIFKVKGPAEDPDVIYLPAESLMAGAKGTVKLAFDLLVNAITLPQEAFSMADDDSPVEEDVVQEGTRNL